MADPKDWEVDSDTSEPELSRSVSEAPRGRKNSDFIFVQGQTPRLLHQLNASPAASGSSSSDSPGLTGKPSALSHTTTPPNTRSLGRSPKPFILTPIPKSSSDSSIESLPTGEGFQRGEYHGSFTLKAKRKQKQSKASPHHSDDNSIETPPGQHMSTVDSDTPEPELSMSVSEAPRGRKNSDFILVQGQTPQPLHQLNASPAASGSSSGDSPGLTGKPSALSHTTTPPNIRSLGRSPKPFILTPIPKSSSDSSIESLPTGEGFQRGEYHGSFTLKAKQKQKKSKTPPHNADAEPEGDDLILKLPTEAVPGMHVTITAEGVGTIPRSVAQGGSDGSDSESDASGDDPFVRETQNRRSFTLQRIAPTNEENGGQRDRDRPLIDKRVRRRANRAFKQGLELLDRREEFENESLGSKLCDCSRHCSSAQVETPPSLRFASTAGTKMAQGFFFPAIPKVLEDAWVAIELFVALFELVFAGITFEAEAVNIFVLVLTIINVMLACLDGFLYFVQSGSCVACFRYARKKLSGENEKASQDEDEDDEDDNDENRSRLQCITPKMKQFLGRWFQVSRTTLSELLLYPLAVADLIELIESRTFEGNDTENDINFSLFNIGVLYLVLSVYFVRSFMTLISIINLRRLPKTIENNYVNIVIKFCFHIFGQNIVHAIILGMVGAKINSEVVEECQSMGSSNATEATKELNASPFLWFVLVAGDVLPLIGVAMFFVVNYVLLKQFSMGFYINTMSTFVSEGFTDVVFEGTGIKDSKEKATQTLEKANLVSTRDDFEKYLKQFSFKKMVLYRLTHPPVILASVFYFALVVTFLVCYLFTEDPCTGDVKFDDDPGVITMFVIGAIVIVVANYQVVLLVGSLLLCVVLVLAAISLFPVIAIVLTPVICIAAAYFSAQAKKKEIETSRSTITARSTIFTNNDTRNGTWH